MSELQKMSKTKAHLMITVTEGWITATFLSPWLHCLGWNQCLHVKWKISLITWTVLWKNVHKRRSTHVNWLKHAKPTLWSFKLQLQMWIYSVTKDVLLLCIEWDYMVLLCFAPILAYCTELKEITLTLISFACSGGKLRQTETKTTCSHLKHGNCAL